MKNIIEQFYYGNITPCESTVPDNRFQKIVSDIDSIESEMLEQCPGIRKLLDQYRDKNGRLTGLEIENAFSKGFRLGTLFMSDVFSGKESLCEQTVHAEMPMTKRYILWGESDSPRLKGRETRPLHIRINESLKLICRRKAHRRI